MSQTTGLTEEIKNWFGDGEWDVDLMLRFGVVTEQQILDCWNAEDKLPIGEALDIMWGCND